MDLRFGFPPLWMDNWFCLWFSFRSIGFLIGRSFGFRRRNLSFLSPPLWVANHFLSRSLLNCFVSHSADFWVLHRSCLYFLSPLLQKVFAVSFRHCRWTFGFWTLTFFPTYSFFTSAKSWFCIGTFIISFFRCCGRKLLPLLIHLLTFVSPELPPLRLRKFFFLHFISHFGSNVAEVRTLYSLVIADKRKINLADP